MRCLIMQLSPVRTTSSMAKLDIPKIVHYMVGRELKDFFPARSVDIGATRVKVRNLSSANGVEDISFDIRKGEIVGMAGLASVCLCLPAIEKNLLNVGFEPQATSRNCDFELKNGSGFCFQGFIAGARFEHTTCQFYR